MALESIEIISIDSEINFVIQMDTIIVNGYDLMWDDVNVKYNDPRPFFFKNDPVQYLGDLHNNGWRIILYWPHLTEFNIHRYPYNTKTNPMHWLKMRKDNISNLFNPFVEIINLNPGETIADYVDRHKSSAASFIIANADHLYDVARYSPIEVFELPSMPPVIPNTKYFVISSDNERRQFFITSPIYRATGLSPTKNDRRQTIENFQKDNPNVNIIVIWSLTYRYPLDQDPVKITNYFTLDRPDQDNQPGVQYYNYGY